MFKYTISAYERIITNEKVDDVIITVIAGNEVEALREAQKAIERNHYEVIGVDSDRLIKISKEHKDYIQFISKAVIVSERCASALEKIEKQLKLMNAME